MSVHEPTAKDDEPLEQPNDEEEEETEESAAFIVSVGEHEEDLDYDLKDAKQTSTESGKKNKANGTAKSSKDRFVNQDRELVSTELEPSLLAFTRLLFVLARV